MGFTVKVMVAPGPTVIAVEVLAETERPGGAGVAGAHAHTETLVLSVNAAPPWVAALRRFASWLETPFTSVLLMSPARAALATNRVLANDVVFAVGHVVAATAAAVTPAAAGAGLLAELHAAVSASSAMATTNAAFLTMWLSPE